MDLLKNITTKQLTIVSIIIAIIALLLAVGAKLLPTNLFAYLIIAAILLMWLIFQIWLAKEIIKIKSMQNDLDRKMKGLETSAQRTEETIPVSTEKYLDDKPLFISSKDNNSYKIGSNFLRLKQCTLMLWVDVPPKGEGLRVSGANKYILAHQTGEARKVNGNPLYKNRFSLRYVSNENEKYWGIYLSKNNGDQIKEEIKCKDSLDSDWHHFLIAWDNSKPKFVVLIDGGSSGSELKTDHFEYWPEKSGGKAVVGSWMPPGEHPTHYCETRIFNIEIYPGFHDEKSEAFKKHFQKRPRP